MIDYLQQFYLIQSNFYATKENSETPLKQRHSSTVHKAMHCVSFCKFSQTISESYASWWIILVVEHQILEQNSTSNIELCLLIVVCRNLHTLQYFLSACSHDYVNATVGIHNFANLTNFQSISCIFKRFLHLPTTKRSCKLYYKVKIELIATPSSEW